MERYIVNVVPPEGEVIRLLVPISSISPVSSLVEEIKKRVSRLNVWPDVTGLCLYLGGADGPMIDESDTLSEVIIDPKVEAITATSRFKKTSHPSVPSVRQASYSETPFPPQHCVFAYILTETGPPHSSFSNKESINLRVITPALARAHPDVRSIPILQAPVTYQTTLREIRSLISDQLEVEIPHTVRDAAECNCAFATQIEQRALRNQAQPDATENQDDSFEFIVVYGRNQVQIMKTSVSEKSSLTESVLEELGEDTILKEITFFGGTLATDDR